MKNKTKIYLLDFFGTQINLANRLNTDKSTVSKCINLKMRWPLQNSLDIVKLTNGGLSLEELRPLQKNKK